MIMPENVNDITSWGYHNARTTTTNKNERKFYTALNISNVAGVLPVVGSIIGIARVVFASASWIVHTNPNQNQRDFYITQIVRGFSEISNWRKVLVIIDLYYTISRNENLQKECKDLIFQTIFDVSTFSEEVYYNLQGRLQNLK